VNNPILFRQPYPVRKAGQRGKEITVPPHAPFKPGQEVVAYFSQSPGFVLYVPEGIEINERLLLQAIHHNNSGNSQS
jgi:hypothetical protein